MSVQNGPGDEAFSTPGANVRSFAGVITLVNNQRGPLRESFAALVAGVLPLAGVSDVMSPEQRFAGETLAAHLAGVRFFTCVRPIVNFQAFRGFQLLATESAQIPTPLVARHVAVGFHFVLLQHRLVLVSLAAHVAFVLRRGVLLRRLRLQLLLDQRRRRRIVVVQTVVLLQAALICDFVKFFTIDQRLEFPEVKYSGCRDWKIGVLGNFFK